MSDITWSELGMAPVITAGHRQYGSVIAETTAQIQQCLQVMLRALNERARALALCAAFDTAIRDARVVQTLAPQAACGYLCAGAVHELQGQQQAAIDVYGEGLRVVPRSESRYGDLVERQTAAQSASRRQIDFMAVLPLDIVVTNLVPKVLGSTPLDSKARCACLYVSHTWRERILKSADVCYKVLWPNVEAFEREHEELVQFAPDIKSLKVIARDSHLILKQLRFSSLTRLDFEQSASRTTPDLISNLSVVLDVNRLAHLKIRSLGVSGQTDPICLDSILETFPNLVSLMITDYKMDLASLPDHIQYPMMQHLGLLDIATPITHRKLVDILRRMPSLVSLRVVPCPDSKPLSMMHQLCPSIRRVEYHNGLRYREWNLQRRHIFNDWQHALCIRDDGASYAVDDMVTFMLSQRHTLEAFEYRCISRAIGSNSEFQPSALCRTTNVDATSFKQLRMLHFDLGQCSKDANGDELALYRFPIWIIQHAPHLESVTLAGAAIHPQIINCIAYASQHLRKFRLEKTAMAMATLHGYQLDHRPHHQQNDDDNDCTDASLLLFFDTMARLQADDPHLLELELSVDRATTSFTAPWLLSGVTKLAHLRSLYLKIDTHLNEHHIPFMNALAHGCVALETLSLICAREYLIVDGVLVPLHQLRHLKHLVLTAKGASKLDLLSLLNCRSLTRLGLYLTRKVSKNVIMLLQQGIPNLICV